MADAGSASRRTKRARLPSEITSDADGACDARCAAFAGTATGGRPTPAEKQEAVDVVKQMKAAELLAKNARPSPNVVACAIALWRGEPFADDRSALRLFGAHPETKVRKMASAIHASVHRPHQMTKWSMHMMTIRLESKPSCTVCVGSA